MMHLRTVRGMEDMETITPRGPRLGGLRQPLGILTPLSFAVRNRAFSQRRWYYSEKGAAWRKANREKLRAQGRIRTRRWRASAKGRQWFKTSRPKLLSYQREYYRTKPERRTYLREKARQYREAKRHESL